MARKLDPKANISTERLVDSFNDLCQSHNELCLAHDELAYRFIELNEQVQDLQSIVDKLVDAVFEPSSEYDN